ncbi:cell envelope biogenesis protein LolA [Alloprevotella sp. OH1205_COT-284]|uniref:LolA-like putative outer membrane lipoprotein chaperone n=1 Tax=Alloprevotella sp. OH1205_COT-284 TaxID=2491043 RepID=UPI000F5DE628|nr:LolA-like putative outer membrane lipoprotein chaperone [Alloprevotella sp. OH1205_COT-284]RRD74848.1 cell envelope biogenesis protein LolA [Alloprevotella sp. OH1205_COT-284]
MNYTRILSLIITLFSITASAQTAKEVLDKTAATLNKGAVTATFSSKGSMGSTGGIITMQGNKFVLTSSQAKIWFDGKTEWAWMQNSDEINVTNPTAAEMASINPMNFVYLYKRGYRAELSQKNKGFEVHLTAQNDKASIKEIYVMIDKSSHLPSSIRFRTKSTEWTQIAISAIRNEGKKKDTFFRFNPKTHPKLNVIDMR